jgi:flagellar biosynthesis protein FlhF
MHLKRYRSETVKDALRAVRAELGPDALVLSSRTVLATSVRGLLGKRVIEITAAAERHEVPEERHPAPPRGAKARKRAVERAVNEIAARLQASGLDAGLAEHIAAQHPVNRRRGAARRGP